MEDTNLIEKCKKGDIEAYEKLVKKYMKKTYSLALYFTKNPSDAWDVSQQGFVNAWKGMKRFDAGSPFFPWLYAIIKNEALTKFKREKKEEKKQEELPLKSIVSPEEHLENEEKIRKLKKALSKLDEEKRQIIYLRHYADMSYKEISKALGLPEGTIMSRLYYARKALLKEYMKNEQRRGTKK
jgi:RNA polymerase sigma factor (sigma-70 family)